MPRGNKTMGAVPKLPCAERHLYEASIVQQILYSKSCTANLVQQILYM